MTEPLHEGLKALGENSKYQGYAQMTEPDPKLLESFPSPFWSGDRNPNGAGGVVDIETSEFTSLCPLTGQPDWATIQIVYCPRETCVESKSLKLYLMSFRNFGEFHESCVTRICNDLVNLLDPNWIKVIGKFTPRGGIKFWPTAEWMNPEWAEEQIQKSIHPQVPGHG